MSSCRWITHTIQNFLKASWFRFEFWISSKRHNLYSNLSAPCDFGFQWTGKERDKSHCRWRKRSGEGTMAEEAVVVVLHCRATLLLDYSWVGLELERKGFASMLAAAPLRLCSAEGVQCLGSSCRKRGLQVWWQLRAVAFFKSLWI